MRITAPGKHKHMKTQAADLRKHRNVCAVNPGEWIPVRESGKTSVEKSLD
jgi:hypothetical protein